ncbi:MAG: DEAD/DEAH box helicase, partial [Actinomycetota bacterium]
MDISSFDSRYPFPLDAFQRRAIEALAAGESVLVAAPTGAGKTVVAEYAVERAVSREGKAFYTTPLKALSNQKYGDFVARYGAKRVGLLTGDNSINGEAPVVVMTTEVLRNMLYERSPTLEGLEVVIMDEVHYLQDPYRGAVWEEVLIHLAPSAAVVCLSATVSNAEEFGDWLGTLRGATRVVIEEDRPVPLESRYLIDRELVPMHVRRSGRIVANPAVRSRIRRLEGEGRGRGRASDRRRSPRLKPRREDVVSLLAAEGMLPAIYFVFSRAGCDRSVEFLVSAGLDLTSREERERIGEFVDLRAAWVGEEDLSALRFATFREGLVRGIAAHHAGMVPVFKETVEELFTAGLVKVVFATETLSLGINMPAKTVVLEDLWKFSGERHEVLTPGEFTQLTGRAGRRGIDSVGYGVVLHQRQLEFDQVAGLASRRTYELRSSFRPSYNMAVNLMRNFTPEQAHSLLNASFGQFQADRSAASLARQVDRDRAGLDGYREHVQCDRGDFSEYWRLREEVNEIRRAASRTRESRQKAAVRDRLATLRPGDVVHVPRASRRGLAVVVGALEGRPTLITHY